MTTPSSAIAGYQQASTYSALRDRYIGMVGLSHKASAVAEEGVFFGTSHNYECTVKSGTTVTVTPGQAVVGQYLVSSPVSVDKTADTTGATGRRDLLVLRVYDTALGDASNDVVVEIVKGSSATSDPTIPTRSIVLWQLDLAAGSSAVTLTDRRNFTMATGGVKLFKGAIPAASALAAGTIVHDLDNGINYQRVVGSKVQRMSSRYIASGIANFNTHVETGGPSGGVWRYGQAGPIVLPSTASTILVTCSWSINAVQEAKFDLAFAFNNSELGHIVVDSFGNQQGTNDGNRAYTMVGVSTDRAAGTWNGCWMGIMCGAGGPVHVKNMIYSWVALG